ncbi:non-LEE-encoded type III secreted effector, partial [Escherichia coli EC4436]
MFFKQLNITRRRIYGR